MRKWPAALPKKTFYEDNLFDMAHNLTEKIAGTHPLHEVSRHFKLEILKYKNKKWLKHIV